MLYTLLPLLVIGLVFATQIFDVKTTNTILSLPGGFEKRKPLATLQKRFPESWGLITYGILAGVLGATGGILGMTVDPVAGAQGAAVVSLPILVINVVTIFRNRKVVRELEGRS